MVGKREVKDEGKNKKLSPNRRGGKKKARLLRGAKNPRIRK